MDKSSTSWILILFTATATLLFYASYKGFDSYMKVQTWAETEAVIVMSRLESGNGVHFDVTARLSGTSKDVPVKVIKGTFVSQKDHRNWSKRYPSGKHVTLYQNPQNPDDIVLEKLDKPSLSSYLSAAFGAVLVLLQLVLLVRWFASSTKTT
jgi:hypothetical protein